MLSGMLSDHQLAWNGHAEKPPRRQASWGGSVSWKILWGLRPGQPASQFPYGATGVNRRSETHKGARAHSLGMSLVHRRAFRSFSKGSSSPPGYPPWPSPLLPPPAAPSLAGRETMAGRNSALQGASGFGHQLVCPGGSGLGPAPVFAAGVQPQSLRKGPWAAVPAVRAQLRGLVRPLPRASAASEGGGLPGPDAGDAGPDGRLPSVPGLGRDECPVIPACAEPASVSG